MASPAAPEPGSAPVPPAADPEAIRACLPPLLVDEFDREWEFVLERAKQDKTLAPVHDLLHKWRHLAYAEMREPGAHARLLAKAEQILRTSTNPDGGSVEEIKDLIEQRLGRTV